MINNSLHMYLDVWIYRIIHQDTNYMEFTSSMYACFDIFCIIPLSNTSDGHLPAKVKSIVIITDVSIDKERNMLMNLK